MKNIFLLTRREQRVVIVIVMALLAATIAKHYRDAGLQAPRPISTSTHLPATPSSHWEEEPSSPEDAP